MTIARKVFESPLLATPCEAPAVPRATPARTPPRPKLAHVAPATGAQSEIPLHLGQAAAPSQKRLAAALVQHATANVLPARAKGATRADNAADAYGKLASTPPSGRSRSSLCSAPGSVGTPGAAAATHGANWVHTLRTAAVLLATACLWGALTARAGHAAWPPAGGFDAAPIRVTLAYEGSDRVNPLFASADYTRPGDLLSGVLATWKTVPAEHEACATQVRHDGMCLFAFSFNELSPMEKFFSASQVNSIKASYLFDAWKWLPPAELAAGTMRLHAARISVSSITVYAARHRNNAKRLFDCEASKKSCTLNLAGESMRKLLAKAARAQQAGGAPFRYVGINHCTAGGDIRFEVDVSRDRNGAPAPASQRIRYDLGPTLKEVRGCTRLLPLEAIREALHEDQEKITVPLPYFHVLPRPQQQNYQQA